MVGWVGQSDGGLGRSVRWWVGQSGGGLGRSVR